MAVWLFFCIISTHNIRSPAQTQPRRERGTAIPLHIPPRRRRRRRRSPQQHPTDRQRIQQHHSAHLIKIITFILRRGAPSLYNSAFFSLVKNVKPSFPLLRCALLVFVNNFLVSFRSIFSLSLWFCGFFSVDLVMRLFVVIHLFPLGSPPRNCVYSKNNIFRRLPRKSISPHLTSSFRKTLISPLHNSTPNHLLAKFCLFYHRSAVSRNISS